MVQKTVEVVSWGGGDSGTSIQEKTPGPSQDTLEQLDLLVGLGTPWDSSLELLVEVPGEVSVRTLPPPASELKLPIRSPEPS